MPRLRWRHPAIVIYDRVVSRNPSFKKTYLLHSIEEPVVNDKVVTIEGHNLRYKDDEEGFSMRLYYPKGIS